MTIPVLLYHRISERQKDTTLCVPPDDFKKHLEYLKKEGYSTISPEELYSHIKFNKALPEKPIMLTFDDGYEDFYKTAAPLMENYNFTATVFIVVDLVGGVNLWDARGGWGEVRLLEWDQIKDLSKRGFAIGSHGLTHMRFTKTGFIGKLFLELRLSKKKIEQKIGKLVISLSFPYGRNNRLVRCLTGLSGYKLAFSINPGVTKRKDDCYRVKRIEINSDNCAIDNFLKIIESTKAINVMQVVTGLYWGGQEMQVVSLAKKLQTRGVNVIVACRNKSPTYVNSKEAALKTVHLKVRGSFDIKAISRLARFIKKYDIDIIHGHSGRDYWVCVLAAKIAGRKVFLTRHLLTPLHNQTSFIVDKADKVIAVSGASKEVLLKDGYIRPEKIEVVYNGIDLNQYNPDIDPLIIRRELNLKPDENLIGCIGRMGCKGQKEILYALNKVLPEFPNLKCLFVSESDEPEELYEDLNKLGLNDHVIFKGFRKDVPNIISSLDILINVPTWEALGMIMVESMACAKPVIASKVGGIPEVVIDRVNGILVPLADIDKLAGAIIYLLANKDKAKDIGKKGRALVEDKFDIEDTIEKIQNLYYGAL